MTCGPVGSGLIPNLWGKPLWEKVPWPFLGARDSASTHSLYAVECPREVRAAMRALLLPFEESKSMCLDRFAHDG